MPNNIQANPSDLPGPLRQFQATEFKEEGFRRLLKTINSAQGEHRLADFVLNEVFDMWWPRLQGKFDDIVRAEEIPEEVTPIRTDREILEEILELSRLSSRRVEGPRIPFAAINDVVTGIKGAVDAIQGETEPQVALTALSSMRPAVEYLIRRAMGPLAVTSRNELAEEFSALKFEYQASNDEDEIPF